MNNRAKDAFTVGPFASSSLNLDFFAENLYFSYLLSESVEKHVALEKEHELAIAAEDTAAITKAKYEIDLYNGIFNLTLAYNFDELES
jgi:hypothetical protein